MARPLRNSVKALLAALALGAVTPESAPPLPVPTEAASPNARPIPPAPPPLPVRAASTIGSLRQLLGMTEAEREAALNQRSARQQAVIRRELSILDGLDATGRESRLRLLAMRVVMDPLIELSPADRLPALAGLAPAQRTFVDSQLRAWDALPAGQRAQLLATHGGWLPLATTNALPPRPPVPVEPPPPPSPDFRSRVEGDVNRWAALGERAQTNATRALLRLFDLPTKDQKAVLARLDPIRRQQVERMLVAFGTLGPDARARAIGAYWRFASMRAEERTRFWQNADRWDSMTPEERRAWRALNAHLPPLPPGLGPSPAMPPAPPASPAAALQTNAQAAR